jgi:deoxyguanosine kinase
MSKIISIEGNIGSGKSTQLKQLEEQYNNSRISFLDEPVSEWLSIKDEDGVNALECFYNDQKKNSFCFQILAYITRLKKLIDCIKSKDSQFIICERSIETDKYVFAKMLYEAGNISSIEWETYNYWYKCFSDISKIDMIIYITTDPCKCNDRIKSRNRNEESEIPLDYLIQCHDKHEEWLLQTTTLVHRIDGNKTVNEISKEIDRIISNYIKE